MAEAESTYSDVAKSGRGAHGLMQLKPSTADEMAKKTGRSQYSLYDWRDSLYLGAAYLRHLVDHPRLSNNREVVLAAYNGGAAYVATFDGKVPPSLRPYVDKILSIEQRM